MHSKGLEYLIILGLCFALGISIYSIKEPATKSLLETMEKTK